MACPMTSSHLGGGDMGLEQEYRNVPNDMDKKERQLNLAREMYFSSAAACMFPSEID